jgi:hypothetical protein
MKALKEELMTSYSDTLKKQVRRCKILKRKNPHPISQLAS